MNNAWGYDNTEDQGNATEMDGPKALREAYKALKAQNEDLNSKLTSFLEDQRKAKVHGVFESLGVPGAAALYQGEPDPEKAKQWAESMRSVFGNGSAQGDTTPAPVQQPLINQDQAAQLAQFSEAGSNGTPMGNFEQASANVGSADNLQALIAAMQNAQRLNG